MLGARNNADHLRTLRSRYGDRGRTNAAGRADDGDPTVFEIADLLQSFERGDAAETQSGHVKRVDACRERRDRRGSDSNILSVAARPPRPDAAKPLHHG